MRCSSGAVLLASLLPFVHSQASTASGANLMPLPSLATIITGTADSQVVTETFVPHIFTEYTTLTATITTTTILTAGGSPVTIVVGPAGVGWAPWREPSGVPELVPPSILPPADVASKDSLNSTTANVVSSSSTLLTSSSSSVPLGTGVSSSSLSGASATSTSLRGPVGTGSTFRSVPLGTGASSSLSSSSSSSQAPLGTGGISSPLSTNALGTGSASSSSASSSSSSSTRVPIGTGASASSSSSSRISLGTGFSGSSSSSSQSQSGGSTSTSATGGPSASSSSTTYPAIVPVGYVTTAFNNPAETITTLSVSGQAAIIYNKETFPGLSTITAPRTVQTSVVETDKDGKSSTFIGGIVVGPGGVFWGPPGLPALPPFPGISPPCIWPFCTGGGGKGGSDPPGDTNPPPPYTPDDPNTPDTNDQKTNEPSDRSTQASSTQGSSSASQSSSSASSSASSSSSSASCSSRTVTDYFVSCASGTSASCSTYSSSAVSGCSVTAATSTEVSACPLGASATPDPTMAGFDYSGGDYPVLNPGYSMDVQWSFTVAEIVETGVIVAANAGPSGSANSSQSTGPVTSTATSSSANPGSTASTLATLTTTNTASTRSSVLASTTSVAPQLCQNFADPHNNVAGECQCSSGTIYTYLPLLTGSKDQCGYTTLPSPAPTTPPSSNTNPYPFTYTDIEDGNIIACKSSSIGNAGVLYTVCEGDRTTVGTDSGIYNHYTQVVQSASAASAASAAAASSASAAAAAVPTANCAFWDEALYWTFEVYNINNWAGNNGDSLHKQEDGCGDLTGWSWTTGDNGGDQHAYFNLPFFIKSGCVERAIKSAGGPGGLSCDGQGVGKKRRALKQESENKGLLKTRRFATDVSFSSRNRNQRRRSLPSEPRSEIELPAIDKRDITIAPKRLTARAEIEKLYEIDSRDLVKRGCLDWLWPGKNIPEEWWCNAVLPGVDACATEIQKKGVVGRFPSMFYTSWGGIGDGSLGVEGTKLWASQNICGRVVDFDGITVGVYQYIVETAVLKPFGKDGLNLPDVEQKKILDPFLKNLSQAFAEQSSGEAYVFVPKGVDFQPTSAWTGWEYPALTRNDKIEKIWKVELDTSDHTQFEPPNGKPPGTKTLLWSKGDPPSAIEPKGSRKGTLPSQIPQDKIPDNWQSSI